MGATSAASSSSSASSSSFPSNQRTRASPYIGNDQAYPASSWGQSRDSPSLTSKALPLRPSREDNYTSASSPQQPTQGSWSGYQGSDDQVYQKAFALSRSTSVRRGQEGRDDQEGMKRYQLEDSAGSAKRYQLEDTAQPSTPRRPDSSQLLSRGAFRDSVASDASFNTITGQSDRQSIAFGHENVASSSRSPALNRRDSVDTVKTAEFDEGGRWDRAWANKAEDEESLYGGSEWGSGQMDEDDEDDDDDDGDGFGGRAAHQVGGSSRGGGLDALRQLASGKGWEGLHLVDVPGGEGYASHQSSHAAAPARSAPQLQAGSTQERIVSLTPSIHGGGGAPRDSHLSSRAQQARRGSNDTVSTIGADGAHVYVWPPTPEGSEVNHNPFGRAAPAGPNSVGGGLNVARAGRAAPAEADAASIHEWEAVSDDEESDSDEESNSSKATPASSTSSPPRQAPGPVSVSDALRHRQASSSSLKTVGHPAGRQPPPPPPTSRYEDPNAARPGLGKTRAAAIAAADGRESIVSDLDVETLRLDGGSSRRDSSSTIGGDSVGRMSVGSVRFGEEDPRDWYGQEQHRSAQRSDMRPVSVDATPMARPEHQRGISHRGVPSRQASLPSPIIEQQQQQPQPRRPPPTSSHPHHPALGSRPPPPLKSNSSLGTPVRPPLASQHQASARSASATTTTTMSSTASKTTTSSGATGNSNNVSFSTPTLTPKSSRTTTTVGQSTQTGPSTAEHFLTQGIAYHEQGDLSRSAYYFERSAKVDGGCVVGMCMWGMTLREGWGARKDPRKGFEWIQRAASKAGEMMKDDGGRGGRGRTEAELKAVRSELKLSVYELGK